jgi:hypothetical protein
VDKEQACEGTLPLVWCSRCGKRFTECISHDKPYVFCIGSSNHSWTSEGITLANEAFVEERKRQAELAETIDAIANTCDTSIEKSRTGVAGSDSESYPDAGCFHCARCNTTFVDIKTFKETGCANGRTHHTLYSLVPACKV